MTIRKHGYTPPFDFMPWVIGGGIVFSFTAMTVIIWLTWQTPGARIAECMEYEFTAKQCEYLDATRDTGEY